jgi:hypothetical protein
MAQKMQAGPCIPVGVQLYKAGADTTSSANSAVGALSHLGIRMPLHCAHRPKDAQHLRGEGRRDEPVQHHLATWGPVTSSLHRGTRYAREYDVNQMSGSTL